MAKWPANNWRLRLFSRRSLHASRSTVKLESSRNLHNGQALVRAILGRQLGGFAASLRQSALLRGDLHGGNNERPPLPAVPAAFGSTRAATGARRLDVADHRVGGFERQRPHRRRRRQFRLARDLQLRRRRGRSVGDAPHRQRRQSHQVDDSQWREPGRRESIESFSRRTRTACWPAENCTRTSRSRPAASIWRWSTRTAPRSSTSTRRISLPSSRTSPTVGRCRTPAPRPRCSLPARPRRRSFPPTIALGTAWRERRLQRRGLADLRPDGPRLRKQSRRRDQLYQPDRHAAAQRHVDRVHPRRSSISRRSPTSAGSSCG